MKNFSIIITILVLLLLYQAANIHVYSLDRHSIELENKVLSYISAIDSLYVWISQLNIDEKSFTPEQLYNILNNKTLVLKIMEKIYEDPIVAIFTGGAVIRILKFYGTGNPYIDEGDIIRMIKTIVSYIDEHNEFLNNSKILTKFINNLFEGNVVSYTISDIKEYSELILKLGIERNISQKILSEITVRLLILAQSLKNGYIKKDILNFIINDTSFRYSIITALFINDVIDRNNIRIISDDNNIIQLHKIITIAQNIDINKLYKIIDLAITHLRNVLNEDRFIGRSLDIEIYDIISQLLEEGNITNLNSNAIVNEHINLSNIPETNLAQNVYSSHDLKNYIDRMVPLEYLIYDHTNYYENDNIRIARANSISKNFSNSRVNSSNLILNKQISLFNPKSSSIQTIVKQVNSYDITMGRASNIDINGGRSIGIGLASYRINLSNISITLVISIIILLLIASLLIISIRFKFFLKEKQNVNRITSTIYKYHINHQNEDPWLKVFIEFWNIIDRISRRFNINIELSNTHREVQHKILSKVSVDTNQYTIFNEVVKYYEITRFSQFRRNMDIEMFKSRLELLKKVFSGGK